MLQDTKNEIVIYYVAGTTFVILLVLIIIVYIYLHQKKVSAFRLQLQQEKMIKQEEIYAALHQGEEKERSRIAEELHDGVSAKLSGLNMTIDYLRNRMESLENRILINKTFEGVNEAINELREISHNLQPMAFTGLGIHNALSVFVQQLNSKGICTYTLFFEADMTQICEQTKLNCYRIVTELLNNINKHAHATEASVQIIAEEGQLEIIVADDGCGFDPTVDYKDGIGLSNILNRVSLNKGILNIDSSDMGTTVIVSIPY